MASASTVAVNFIARTRTFTAGVTKARGSLATFRKTAGKAVSSVAGLAKSLAPLGAGGAFFMAARGAERFSSALQKSAAIMDTTTAQLAGMEEAAIRAARSTSFGADEIAGGFRFLASAGMDAEQSIAAIGQVSRFAQAGMMDLAQATDLATDVQSAIGLDAQDAAKNLANLTRVTDVLTKSNMLANTTVEQMGEAMTTKAATAARLVNKPLEEVVATLAVMAKQGVKGSLAGTQLAIVLRDLQTKAIDNADAFKRLKVEVFDSDGKMRHMADIVGDLEVLLTGASDETKKMALQTLGFADKSVAATMTLIGFSDQIREWHTELEQAGGITDKVADKSMTKLEKATAKLGAAWTGLTRALRPAIEGMAVIIEDAVMYWSTFGTRIDIILLQIEGAWIRLTGGIKGAMAGISGMLGEMVRKIGSFADVVSAMLDSAFTLNPAEAAKNLSKAVNRWWNASGSIAEGFSSAVGRAHRGRTQELFRIEERLAAREAKLERDLADLYRPRRGAPRAGALAAPEAPVTDFDEAKNAALLAKLTAPTGVAEAIKGAAAKAVAGIPEAVEATTKALRVFFGGGGGGGAALGMRGGAGALAGGLGGLLSPAERGPAGPEALMAGSAEAYRAITRAMQVDPVADGMREQVELQKKTITAIDAQTRAHNRTSWIGIARF